MVQRGARWCSVVRGGAAWCEAASRADAWRPAGRRMSRLDTCVVGVASSRRSNASQSVSPNHACAQRAATPPVSGQPSRSSSESCGVTDVTDVTMRRDVTDVSGVREACEGMACEQAVRPGRPLHATYRPRPAPACMHPAYRPPTRLQQAHDESGGVRTQQGRATREKRRHRHRHRRRWLQRQLRLGRVRLTQRHGRGGLDGIDIGVGSSKGTCPEGRVAELGR